MKKIILSIIIISISILQGTETAGMSGAFLRYGLDARSESLGRAVTADRDNANSMFFNPANISSVSGKQILTGMKILSMDRNFAYLSYVHPIREGAVVSAGILYTGTDDIEGRDKYGDLYDTFSYNENLFYINFGLKPKEFLSIGVTAKLLWARFPEFDTDNETVSSLTFAYDLGVNAFIPGYSDILFGLTMKNVKGKNSWDSSKVWTDGTSSDDYYPVSYSAGVSWNPEFNREISIYGDLNSINMEDYGYGLGLEWKRDFDQNESALALRMGTISGFITAGLGYEFAVFSKKMIIDYSFTHEDISEFDPHSLSWRFFF